MEKIIMFNLSALMLNASGLSGLQKDIITNWVGPIFFVALAFFALKALKDQRWMTLVTLVGVAAVVGLIIFNAEKLFGSGGNLTKGADNIASKVNAISYMWDMRHLIR